MNAEFWFFMYLWLMVASFFVVKIFYHEDKIPPLINITLLIFTPIIIIDLLVSKIITMSKGKSIMKTITIKTAKTISNIVDRAAIRFINITDMLRGTYEK